MKKANNFLEICFDDDMKELVKTNLPDPSLLDYYKRLRNREVFWNTLVDEDLVDLSHQIIQWNKEDKNIDTDKRTPIKIFINSDGGCLNSVMNFINLVQLSKTPIYTYGMGKAYSAGFLMLLAGHKRYCFKNSEGLLHSGSFGIMNSTEKVMDYIDHTKKIEKMVKEYVVDSSKISAKEYDKRYREEWYMTASEMLKLGIVDYIVTDLDDII